MYTEKESLKELKSPNHDYFREIKLRPFGIVTTSCLSQDLHFFQKRSCLNFVGSYLQKRGVIHQRRNCSIRRVNRFEACIVHAQNIQNKNKL